MIRDALLFDPVYTLLGVDAAYTPPGEGSSSRALRVMDHSQGESVDDGVGAFVVRPTVHARATDLDGSPTGGTLVVGGVAYRIASHGAVLTRSGRAGGQRRLILERLDD
ncbi:head-tail joining protein [Pararhodospirillum photometricum]|uniref:Uncharacterized protein n=1 Tax=Pararhodospirillum photometricum DSM 122 TaxID=1150469 RepID=H6SKQ4_PARPM|nr:hypothetical protein [Pararhodospirillum photometricum]CCG08569.1 unnamed protein product [Pararhodospirillum photometricum DSM 122]